MTSNYLNQSGFNQNLLLSVIVYKSQKNITCLQD